MRTVSISVTEASRNFSDYVNRARYQGTTFLLHKNGIAVARIAPVERNTKEKLEIDADSSAEKHLAEDAPGAQILYLPDIW
ncbi:MAG TPA: hypothetical protein VHD85_03775 [Terracidiphilus sp.]|nr:hypothetical protein [Terracidiphilus sp.]